MVLASRRPRTVLGRLVARRYPVGPAGLGAGWLPGASWGGGFPWCGSCRRGGPGSRLGWPCRLLRGGAVPCRASPGPVAEPASPEHQRCRVVPGRLRVVLPQRGEPVLGSPPRGVRGIGDDHVQARVGGHLHQPAAELPGRDPGDRAAEPAAPLPAGRPAPVPLAALGPRVGEVQVFDRDGPRPVLPRGGDEGADGAAEPPVPGGGGQPGQVQRHRERHAHDVPVRRHDRDREVPGVDVDRQHRIRPQLTQSRGRAGSSALPRRVEVPAPGFGVDRDVIADGTGGGLGGDLIAPVGELHRARQPVAAVRPVPQMGERGGKLDLQPALVRVMPYCLVAPPLAGLAVRGQE